MTAADRIDRRFAKLLVADADGAISHLPRAALASLFQPGDLVVANDAATLPASLHGVHRSTGEPIEARLAGWDSFRDPTRFVAVVFGAGDHRMLTEERPSPPWLSAGDRLEFGPLIASVGQCHVWTPLADQGLFLALRGSWVRSCLRPSFAENRIRWP